MPQISTQGPSTFSREPQALPTSPGRFTDPVLPAGYAPFNIQLLGGKLYVTYALQGSGKDEQAGPGLGFVSVFDTQGNFLGRVGSMGTLNAPWGLAIAPSSFGKFAGDLLVGNFGDGTINAFNLATDTFVGQLQGLDGKPLVIDGLWGLTAGNDGSAGSIEHDLLLSRPARRVERALRRDHRRPRAEFCGPRTHRWGNSHRGMDLQASRCNAPLSVSIDLIAEGQPVGHGASPWAGWLILPATDRPQARSCNRR